MAKTRFFCIAVEGGTTDGRVIERDWIEQMAAGYNPATYTASINCEHIRGYSPEPPFNSYGTVTALKAQDVELVLDGKTEKRLGLYAQFDANDQLLAVNRAKQKLFTSCEISPNFGATGKAGLVGVAITDNPASLGTEMLEFSATKGDASPLAARKLDKANLFTAATEATIVLDGDGTDPTGLFASLKGMFDAFAASFGKQGQQPANENTSPAGGTGSTQPPANDNDLAAFARSIGETVTSAMQTYAAVNDPKVAALATDIAEIKGLLGKTEDRTFSRQPATGGGGNAAHETDC